MMFTPVPVTKRARRDLKRLDRPARKNIKSYLQECGQDEIQYLPIVKQAIKSRIRYRYTRIGVYRLIFGFIDDQWKLWAVKKRGEAFKGELWR